MAKLGENLIEKGNQLRASGSKSTYSKEIGEWVCEIIATHPIGLERLYEKYKAEGFPHDNTIFLWCYRFPEFREMYALAKESQADAHAEETIRIADDMSRDLISTDKGEAPNSAAVGRAKLMIDTRKWYVGVLSPRKYGNRTFNETKVELLSHEEALKELE